MKLPPLDQLEGYLTGERTNGLGRPLGVETALALVAELRAARQVVEAAEALIALPYHSPDCPKAEQVLIDALWDYKGVTIQ